MTIPATSAARLGQEDEGDRRQQHAEQHEPLELARDSAAPQQRRDGQAEAGDAAQEGHPTGETGNPGHLALEERTVAAREREEPLARDHDAVRAGHAAERWQRCCVCTVEQGGEAVPLHP